MEFKIHLKNSDQHMKANFGIVTDISQSQKKDYENRINRLETDLEELTLATESQKKDYENRIKSLEEEIPAAYEQGFNEGKDNIYSGFWDAYQENGKRSNYARAFGGQGWTDTTFTPKYDISPTESASYMFAETAITDLGTALENSGRTLSVSTATRTDYMFYCSNVEVLPRIDISSATNIESMFSMAEKLHTIPYLKFADDGSQELGSDFFYCCNSLTNLTIGGYIGSDVDLRYSPLSRASLDSLLWHLYTKVTGKYVYLSKDLIDRTFETSEGANNGSSGKNWRIFVGNRPMWKFQLV